MEESEVLDGSKKGSRGDLDIPRPGDPQLGPREMAILYNWIRDLMAGKKNVLVLSADIESKELVEGTSRRRLPFE